MSIDKSLKTSGALSKHRNVLSRAERIAKLQDEGHWEEGRSPYGIVKVAHRKAKVGSKVKQKATAEEAGATKPAGGPGGS